MGSKRTPPPPKEHANLGSTYVCARIDNNPAVSLRGGIAIYIDKFLDALGVGIITVNVLKFLIVFSLCY